MIIKCKKKKYKYTFNVPGLAADKKPANYIWSYSKKKCKNKCFIVGGNHNKNDIKRLKLNRWFNTGVRITFRKIDFFSSQ